MIVKFVHHCHYASYFLADDMPFDFIYSSNKPCICRTWWARNISYVGRLKDLEVIYNDNSGFD